jgi:nucleoside-diphosphate-sugar epimerase
MKILITGGTGFVGTQLTSRLIKDNHEGNRSWGLLISQMFFHRRNAAVVLEHQLCCEMI